MASPLVVIVGSINEDLVVTAGQLPRSGETVTGGAFRAHGGGKGANQAVAAVRMGAEVRFVGAVGRDAFGELALDRLEAAGLDIANVARVEGVETGIAVIVVDREGENQIAVAPGANAALDASIVRTAFEALDADIEGVFLANLEIGDEPLIEATRRATARDLTVIVNPAPARPIPDLVLDSAPILTPNEGEALALSGRTIVEDAAAGLFERTASPVVVTRGASGATIVDERGARTVPAIDVDAIDTTGAGDVFNGVLATRIAAGDAIDEGVRWAVTAAGLATTYAGARSRVDRDAVRRRLEEQSP